MNCVSVMQWTLTPRTLPTAEQHPAWSFHAILTSQRYIRQCFTAIHRIFMAYFCEVSGQVFLPSFSNLVALLKPVHQGDPAGM